MKDSSAFEMKRLPFFLLIFFICTPNYGEAQNNTPEAAIIIEKHYVYPGRPPSFIEHQVGDNTIASPHIVVTSNEQQYAHIILDNHKPETYNQNNIKKRPQTYIKKKPIPVVSPLVTVKPMKGQTVLGFQIVHSPSSIPNEINSKPHTVLDYLPGEKPPPIQVIHSNIAVIKKPTSTRRPTRPTRPTTRKPTTSNDFEFDLTPESTTPSSPMSSVTFPPFDFVTFSSTYRPTTPSTDFTFGPSFGTSITPRPRPPNRRPTPRPTRPPLVFNESSSSAELIEITEAPGQLATVVVPLVPSRPLGTYTMSNNNLGALSAMSKMLRMTIGIFLVFLPTALVAVGILTSQRGAPLAFGRRRSDRGGCDVRCLVQAATAMETAKRDGLANFKRQVTRFPAPTARKLKGINLYGEE